MTSSPTATTLLPDDDPIARRAVDLKRFVDENDRWPSTVGATPAERRLGVWLAQLRRAAKGAGPRAKTFTDARRAYLDRIAPGWEGTGWEEAFRERVQELAAFLTANGRVPHIRSADPAEKRLAAFRHNQISELHGVAKTATRAHRMKYLDRHAPGWRPRAAPAPRNPDPAHKRPAPDCRA